MIMVPQNREERLFMISSRKNKLTPQTIPIFITKLKRPKVNILRGEVRKFKIGFIKKLAKPKAVPMRIKACQGDVIFIPKKLVWGTNFNSIPETNSTARNIPKIPVIIWRKKRFTF